MGPVDKIEVEWGVNHDISRSAYIPRAVKDGRTAVSHNTLLEAILARWAVEPTAPEPSGRVRYCPFEQTERFAFWKLNQPFTDVDGDWPKYCRKTRSCKL